MASWTAAQVCRFCANPNDVIVDLIKTQLHEKLVTYFPLKFEPADLLPKFACTECASTIQQMEGFVLKAQEVEQDLMERASRAPTIPNNVMSAADIRSLACSVAAKTAKPKAESVKEVLRKLNATSLVVKKLDKKPLKEEPLNEDLQQLEETEPFLKMKMEVLDEEIENLPAEDFVQYNDTDDDEAGELSAETSFHKIASVDIKELHVVDDSSQGCIDEETLMVEMYEPDVSKSQVVTRQRPNPVKIKPKPRVTNSKGIVINLTDPCHYVCVTCKGKFSSFEDLQTHIDQNIACKKINCTCEHCGKVCESRRALYQHKQTHNPKPQLICDQCGKVYTNSFNLENHKSQVHGEEIEEFGYVYKCCEQSFPTRRELNDHIATHSKKLNLLCDTCGKSFTSHKALRSHNMSHMNVRPFSCGLCDKSFRTKLLLVQHSHVHTGVKVFNCDVCEKSFAKKESLKKHYKMHSSEPVTWSSTGEKIISVKPIAQLQQQQFIEYTALQDAQLAGVQ